MSGVLLVLPLEVLFGFDVSELLPDVSELLLLFFLCFFFLVVVSAEDALESELEPLVPLMSPELPLLVEDGLLLPCGLDPVPGELVPDCCATAMPIEKRAAVEIARSFLDIRISCCGRSGFHGMRLLPIEIAEPPCLLWNSL